MKNKYFFILLISLVIVFSVIAKEKTQIKSMVFISTNDIHGSISAIERNNIKTGGFAFLQDLVNKERENQKFKGNDFLLVDAGDIFQGTLEGDLSKGRTLIDLMNILKYDFAAIGNHDFDQGIENLKGLINQANFKFLAMNIKNRPDLEKLILPYTIYKGNNINVGIIGLTPPDMDSLTSSEEIKRIDFSYQKRYIKKIIKKLKRQGADMILLLTHQGVDKDIDLADNIEGIDLIIGGHSHTYLQEAYKSKKGAIVTQAGAHLQAAGRTEIFFDNKTKKIIGFDYKLISLNNENLKQDKTILEKLNNIEEKLKTLKTQKIGYLSKNLPRDSAKSSLLGNYICDVAKKYLKLDAFFQNPYGIRDNLNKGPITYEMLYKVLPFSNTVVIMKMKGLVIKELLEQSATLERGLLQMSGIIAYLDLTKPEGERVEKILINNKELQENKEYLIGTNSFLANGGDLFTSFLKGKNNKETGILLRDILIQDKFQTIENVDEKRYIIK